MVLHLCEEELCVRVFGGRLTALDVVGPRRGLRERLPLEHLFDPVERRGVLVGREVERRDLADRAVAVAAPSEGLDRKSTRLNSSHANISYAVFCLKKKKYTICLLTSYMLLTHRPA